MEITPGSPVSMVAFLAIVGSILAALLVGTWTCVRAASGAAAAWVATLSTAAGLCVGLGVFGWVVEGGVLAAQPWPRIPLAFALLNLGAIGYALAPPGRRLARGLSFSALVGFQAFRLPLELVLHDWVASGTIPGTMTWTGSNWDIVTGVLAIPVAALAGRHTAALWVFNVVGLALLVNVGRVAILSSPLPFAWAVDPPLVLILHMPYALIGPVCVAGALAGHVLLTRKLLTRPDAPSPPAPHRA